MLRDFAMWWLMMWEGILLWCLGVRWDEGSDDNAHCEHCADHGMVLLGDGRLLCWEHYTAECKAVREARNG